MSIRTLKYLSLSIVAVLVPGCSDGMVGPQLAADAPGLAAQWVAAPDDIGTVGWHQQALTLEPDGRFASLSSSYGLYEGQQRNEPSAWTRIEGTFRVEGNRLYFEPESLTWWDHFESASFPLARRRAYPWGTLFDDATFVVKGNALVLSFNVYPADAPVPVTAEYVRVK